MDLGNTAQAAIMAAMDPKKAMAQGSNRGVGPAQRCRSSAVKKSDLKSCKSSSRDCSTSMDSVKIGEIKHSSSVCPDAMKQVKVEEVELCTKDKEEHNALCIKTEIKDEAPSDDDGESFDMVTVIVGGDSFWKCHDSMDGSKTDLASKASAKYHNDTLHKAAVASSTQNSRGPLDRKKKAVEEKQCGKECDASNHLTNNKSALIIQQDSINQVNVTEVEKTPFSELEELATYLRQNGEAPFASEIQATLNEGFPESSAAESEFSEANELHVDPRRCDSKRCEKTLPGYSGREMHLTPSEENATNTHGFAVEQQLNQKAPTGEKPYECLDCDRTYNVLYDLKRHQRIHTGEKPYVCTVCKKAFRLSSTWSIHQRSHTGEKPYECAECKKTFTQLSTLHSHQRIHTGEKPYECRQCAKSFTDSSTLRQHERTHTGEKPYQCLECMQTFSQSSVLRRHEAIHTGEKPYECTECKKNFSDSSSLIAHQRIHTGEKPYQCTWCEKTFRYSSTLRGHHRIHTGEKPYECEECKKTFSQFSSLMQHRRIHTGEKPYACTVCSKAFSVSYALTKHYRIHTGEKPFECKECSKTFRLSSDLTRHYRIHNKVSVEYNTTNASTVKSEH